MTKRPPETDQLRLRRGKVTDVHRAEAEALRQIWDSKAAHRKANDAGSQFAFGHKYEIGNQAAVGFFLNGKTALSLKAALGFARGLGCAVADFSPRLAALIEAAPATQTLSTEEQDLVDLYRRMSPTGQVGLLAYARGVVDTEHHTRLSRKRHAA